MKKILALIFVLITMLSFVACDGGDGDEGNEALEYSTVGEDGSAQLPGYKDNVIDGNFGDLPLMPLDPDINLG